MVNFIIHISIFNFENRKISKHLYFNIIMIKLILIKARLIFIWYLKFHFYQLLKEIILINQHFKLHTKIKLYL